LSDKVLQIYGMIQTGREACMVTMGQLLEDLVKRGLLTREADYLLAIAQPKFD